VRIADLSSLAPTMSTAEAAEVFGVHVNHLWKLAREGRAPITPLKLGHALRWPTLAVLRCVGVEPGEEDAEPGGSAPVVPLDPTKGCDGRPQR
jgi:hypothetical protein